MSTAVSDKPRLDDVPLGLPDRAHIGAVHLQVGDLARSVEYYRTVLGLDVLETGAARMTLGVRGEAPLVYVVEKRGVSRAPARGRFGLYHFALLLPDRASLGRFAAHALRLGLRPGMAHHGVSEALYLSDPDGLGIEVYADTPRAFWRYRGNELVMTSESLDIGSLIAAGEGGEWAGAPAGTVVGHVHLHVGDLATAERFYHRALGFNRTMWSFPGALFFSAGGYHHHVGTNIWSPGPAASSGEARLLRWELVVPTREHAIDAGQRLRQAGYDVNEMNDGVHVQEPWGTHVLLAPQSERQAGP